MGMLKDHIKTITLEAKNGQRKKKEKEKKRKEQTKKKKRIEDKCDTNI